MQLKEAMVIYEAPVGPFLRVERFPLLLGPPLAASLEHEAD